jgi:FkbM family methyltransferase
MTSYKKIYLATKDFVRTSLTRDIQVLFCAHISLLDRLSLVTQRYFALFWWGISGKAPEKARLLGKTFFIDNIYAPGLLQLGVVDYCKEALLPELQKKQSLFIMDIGAHTGEFSSFTRYFYPQATIVACEPAPKSLVFLKKNLASDPKIHIEEVAISNHTGSVDFYFQPVATVISGLVETEGSQKITVPTVPLDSLWNQYSNPIVDLLKIDVEGGEVDVLKGAQKTLAKTKYLLIEVSCGRGEYSFSQILSYLNNPAYNFELQKVGTVYYQDQKPVCVDLLLKNTKLAE